MTSEPKVTGLSPMTGPPGTKITVRGENFGQSSDDIISLTINGADCLPYLEWKSSSKIITRCTKVLGSGEIVITTNSGGVGTCDVRFNCYEETVGPTDESAVWVSEIDFQTSEKEKLTYPGSNEECSVEISSSRFSPHLYLVQNFSNATLDEIAQLKVELLNKSDPEVITSNSNRAALLKSNLPVIMECLQILEHLSKVITTSKDTSIENIVKSIRQSLSKTHELFDPLLAQRDLVQSIESAMNVFRQNETLFNLPSAIESSIKSKNYDSVVKEISGVLFRLKTINIDQSLTEKIQSDVTNKVDKLKATIESQLLQSCKSTNNERNIDEVKRLISHLNRLGPPVNFDVWIALKKMSASLKETLSERFNHFLKLFESSVNGSAKTKKPSDTMNEPPYVVRFVQCAMDLFQHTYYDIVNLGHSYFDSDEFACEDSEDVKQAKKVEFNDMISEPIVHLCVLLSLALVPDSPRLEEQTSKQSRWPSSATEMDANSLRHVLQSVIKCHVNLTKKNLPSEKTGASLKYFGEFVYELRVKSMEILFSNATRFNKSLHHKEDWMIEVDDLHGGITKLPLIFEKNVIETWRFANETIFKTSGLPDEKSILEGHHVQPKLKELAQELINSFRDCLDNALIDSEEHLAESTRMLLACRDSNRVPSKYMNRLLITICNCQFTRDEVFVRLQKEFQGLDMSKVFMNCTKRYCEYIEKIIEKFCRIKCADLNKSLKESSCNSDQERYNHELQINLMIVNSQIFLVAPQLVNKLMTSIVNAMLQDQTSHKL